ncbi:TonB-dependent receptor plug domain-containing protein [Stakelama pacifica]|uniref:Iron complex outermembrane receptor protein n=1 Tax=Stakelama pacifica TaxID=517720 RepID=A0A4R6FRW5_9SPHN|nr:TonB-dependent receptor [Stakelama pacifica]TDN84509.1 iron complex outermembrane receptor protein [Stakelama pacifica]GGO93601.1 ligand-gated channel [Stakelama pacifica]
MKNRLFTALVILQCGASMPALAQTTTSADYNPPAGGNDIVVTGTREAGRTQFDAMAPVDVISGDAINQVVSGDLSDGLAELLPSFNVQRLPAADGQAFVRPATLRGLSPDETLVLVNGKRFHRSALLGTRGSQGPDLSAIPSFAIGRVEVLRDGAAAQYGSDAIAGVINIMLDDTPGISAFAQASEYYEGDGKEYQTGIRGGLALGDRGSVVFTGQYDHAEATSRTRQRPDAIEFQAAHPDLDVPDPVQRWGQPDLESVAATVNAHYEIADAADLYGFVLVRDGEGVTDFNWRNPDTTGSVYGSSPAFPDFSFRSIYPAGFSPKFGSNYSDLQSVAGVRGDLSDAFSYDLSGSEGRSRIRYTLKESLNASLGPQSPTQFYLGMLEQREFNLNADFVYKLDAGMFRPVNIAFGGERRVETYVIGAGDPASYAIGPGANSGLAPNSNGFPGFSPLQAGEHGQRSYAGYMDVEVQPVEALTLGAAGRYEDFSVFGDTFNYKFSGRFEFTPAVALRATYSTGFRAPTPGQLYSTRTSQGLDTNTLQVFTSGRLSPSDPIAVALGAQPLKPEKSDSVTAGLTFRSDFGLSGSVDAYQIKLKDRFGQSNSFAVPADIPNPNQYTSVSFFTNDFDTRTRGVDVVLNYVRAVGPGQATISLAYNYNKTKVTSAPSASIPGDTQRIVFEERLPQHNATGRINYTVGPLTLMARGRYYGAWTDSSGNASGDIFQRFGARAFLDVSAEYRFADHFSIRAGADNVLDTYPDEATFQANRGLIYSRNAPYDTDGGQYYVRLGMDF